MISHELAEVAKHMEDWSAPEILAWATGHYKRVSCATGFGAEGCLLIDMAARRELPIHFFTLDTGLLFPETYDLWRRLEDRYGIRIHDVRPAQTVAEQAAEYGDALWSRDPSRCCAMRKVAPLRQTLQDYDAWVTAIRRDQTSVRATAKHLEWDETNDLAKVNPLLRWSKEQVWQYVKDHEVPFNPLYDRGYGSIGCYPCTTPVAAGEDERAGRWRGHQKTECGLHVGPAGVTRLQGAETSERANS